MTYSLISQKSGHRAPYCSGGRVQERRLYDVTKIFLAGVIVIGCFFSGHYSLVASPQDASTAKPDAVTDLLAGEFDKNWQFFSSDPSKNDVWKIIESSDKELVLVCSGEPKGFAFTTAEFRDFELNLEWRYPQDPSGNSGILVCTQNEPRIWPTSIQIQLHQPKAGSIFPSGDAVTDSTLDAATDLARPVNVWNECRVLSRGGRIAVDINGKKAGEISGAKPASGRIALQSEGSVVEFRRIRLKNLPPEVAKPTSE